MLLTYLFAALLLALPSFHTSHSDVGNFVSARKSASQWDKMFADKENIKKLEDDLMTGDEEEELMTEGHIEYLNMERRKKNAPKPEDFDVQDPQEWMTHSESTVGPTMIFAKLKHIKPSNGEKLVRDDTQLLAAMWKELLFTGGVEVTPYDIEWDTILTTLQRGWNGFQLKDFLLSREEVSKVTWNSMDYYREGEEPKGGGGGGGGGGEKKKKKKKKTRKKKKRKKKKKKKKKRDKTQAAKTKAVEDL